MDIKENLKEILIIILASLILALTIAFKDRSLFQTAAISFLIILSINIIIKKSIGYYLEINVKTKFWSIYHFWFRKDTHFKKPLPMIWLPLILTLFTK